MRFGIWPGVVFALTASLAFADAPTRSLRPLARLQPVETSATIGRLRPEPRPSFTTTAAAQPANPPATRKGSVCKNNNIKGTVLDPITARTKGCGIKAPVQVTAINGIRLDPPATINCATADALATWIDDGLQPAFGNRVVQMNIAASYVCRSQNNLRGARVSEHGLGNAIDISGFILDGGRAVTVVANFAAQIRRAHKAACGTFRTTLGPGSDGYHEDHIHLDVSQRGGGAYCR